MNSSESSSQRFQPRPGESSQAAITRYYQQFIDYDLIRQGLARTVDERIDIVEAMNAEVAELREAVRKTRDQTQSTTTDGTDS